MAYDDSFDFKNGTISLERTKTKSQSREEQIVINGQVYLVTREPYRLDDMQDSLKHFLTSQEGKAIPQLKPTHLALKIEITSLEQLHKIEADSSLILYYHPFGLIPQGEVAIEYHKQKVKGSNLFSEECRCDETEIEGIEYKPVYVFWPASRRIPEEFNYKICYESFLPSFYLQDNPQSDQVVGWLTQQRDSGIMWMGIIRVYDNRLNSYVPLPNGYNSFMAPYSSF